MSRTRLYHFIYFNCFHEVLHNFIRNSLFSSKLITLLALQTNIFCVCVLLSHMSKFIRSTGFVRMTTQNQFIEGCNETSSVFLFMCIFFEFDMGSVNPMQFNEKSLGLPIFAWLLWHKIKNSNLFIVLRFNIRVNAILVLCVYLKLVTVNALLVLGASCWMLEENVLEIMLERSSRLEFNEF